MKTARGIAPKSSADQAAENRLMDHAELSEYSLRKVLLYLSDPKAHARATGLELGVSSRAMQAGVASERDGVFVPFAVLARDLVVGTAVAGGNTVATDVARSRLIDLLRPASAVIAAGAQVINGLQGNVAIPRLNSGAAIQWVAENVAPTEGALATEQIVMTPKTAAGYVDIGRRLLLQTGGDVSQIVANDLRAGIATAIDQASLFGSGTSNQPRGIMNTSGIGSVSGGANGAAPTYDHAVDLEAAVANANTLLERPGYVTNSRVRSKLEKTQMFGVATGLPVWQADRQGDILKGRPAFVTNSVPANLTKGTSAGICSALIYGNWFDLIIGMWGQGVTIMTDPFTLGTTGAVRLIVMVDCDIALRYPTSFSVMTDALAA